LLRFALRRLVGGIPLIVLISLMVFSLVLMLPGDPAITIAGDSASPETIERIREQLGENDPILERYFDWAGPAVRGDFGTSLFSDQEVTEAIRQRAPATISLTIMALVIALMISVPAGLVAGLNPGTKFDRLATIGASMGVAIPSFWMGLLLIVFFAVKNDWLPAIGYTPITEDPVEWFKHLILPGFSLGLAASATLTRQLRSSIITVMEHDYIRTARAKGLRTRKVVFKHLLKNASVPAVTALGLQVPILLSGTVIIEGLFSINGIGRYAVEASLLRDLPVVQAVVMMSAVVVVLSNLAVDISYGYLNPKVRLQ
jgi:peptide/nickel transport system permease protein|tara:strand:+ start:161 stop:1105 length:945 start_codon:yes stop_codon:yes gene_type:complete